jgi:hypothetical protein
MYAFYGRPTSILRILHRNILDAVIINQLRNVLSLYDGLLINSFQIVSENVALYLSPTLIKTINTAGTAYLETPPLIRQSLYYVGLPRTLGTLTLCHTLSALYPELIEPLPIIYNPPRFLIHKTLDRRSQLRKASWKVTKTIGPFCTSIAISTFKVNLLVPYMTLPDRVVIGVSVGGISHVIIFPHTWPRLKPRQVNPNQVEAHHVIADDISEQTGSEQSLRIGRGVEENIELDSVPSIESESILIPDQH